MAYSRSQCVFACTYLHSTYALGHGLEHYDKSAVEKAVKNVRPEVYRFGSLVMEVLRSVPFENRREEMANAQDPKPVMTNRPVYFAAINE